MQDNTAGSRQCTKFPFSVSPRPDAEKGAVPDKPETNLVSSLCNDMLPSDSAYGRGASLLGFEKRKVTKPMLLVQQDMAERS